MCGRDKHHDDDDSSRGDVRDPPHCWGPPHSMQSRAVLVCWGSRKTAHGLGSLNSTRVFSPNPGSWKSKVKASWGWFLVRPPSLACRWSSSRGRPSVHNRVLISSPYDTSCTHPSGLMSLYYLFQDPVSKFSHILKNWGPGLQHINCSKQHMAQPSQEPTFPNH